MATETSISVQHSEVRYNTHTSDAIHCCFDKLNKRNDKILNPLLRGLCFLCSYEIQIDCSSWAIILRIL